MIIFVKNKLMIRNGFFLFLSLLVASLILTSCGASKYSGKRKGENINANVKENSEVIDYALFQQQDIPLLADRGKGRGIAVGQMLSAAGKGVLALINMERKKYTAGYEQVLTDLVFYDQLSERDAFDPVGMQFAGFELLRTARVDGKTTDTAIWMAFEPDLSNPYEIVNNSFFRLKLKDLQVNYAKAKVAGTKWFLPWSWGKGKSKNKLNVDVEIIFRASWVTEDGHYYNNEEIGRFLLTLRDVPMDPKDPNRQKYFDDLKGTTLLGRCMLVPRSYGYYYTGSNKLSPCYGQGIYSIETKVKEAGAQNFILKMTSYIPSQAK